MKVAAAAVAAAGLATALGVLDRFNSTQKALDGVSAAVEQAFERVAGSGDAPEMGEFRQREQLAPGSRGAAVFGATGATGSKVLEELLKRDGWGRIVVIGRRPPAPEIADGLNQPQPEFIELKSLDEEEGAAAAEAKLSGVDTFFNCIGTTRSAAGSAQAFKDIEVGITEKVANLAAKSGVQSAAVVSAQGASPDRSVAPTWFHPLFYGKCMGLKERAMEQAGFKRVTVFRPGMLNRQVEQNDRFVERVFGPLLGGLKVSTLAAALVNDQEAKLPTDKEDTLTISGNSRITQYSKI